MSYILAASDGYLGCIGMPQDQIEEAFEQVQNQPMAFALLIDTHSVMDDNVQLEVALFQKSSISKKPEDTVIKLTWRDTYHNDVVLSVMGTLNPDPEDYASILSVADATEEFATFDLAIGKFFEEFMSGGVPGPDEIVQLEPMAMASLAGPPPGVKPIVDAYNEVNTLGRKFVSLPLAPDTEKTALDGQNLFDAIVEFDDTPNYLVMFYNNNLPQFQTALRAAEKLNTPLLVELDPTLSLDQACQIAEELSAKSHLVWIYWNLVLSRPNNAQTLRGRKKPRYALGAILGYMLLRNSNTNAQGLPPLQNPVAGHYFPMPWGGMEMRSDIKLNDEALDRLAKAKINPVMRKKYDTGIRFVVGDCLTQYDSKTSVLRLTNASEISMFIDKRLIEICERHLLKGKTTYKADALRECQSFMEACASPQAGLLVESEDLGGKYVLAISDRADRPHDAIELNSGYRPEGAVRAVYLNTSVHK